MDCNIIQSVIYKMATRAPKMADKVWKGVFIKFFGHSDQLSRNKLFGLSTPYLRKVRNGGKKG